MKKKLPNLLGSRKGRLSAFFLLYMTEGIPLGFAAIAVATQLRRQGVGPAEIGAFVGSFYLPWAFKWAFGPIIDVFSSPRLGRRRGWILGTQLMMALTLVSLLLLDLPAQLGLFTAILLVHNSFGAMQDVAIDALACNTLPEDERGVANGMMFAGAYVGQALGGSGVLFLSAYTGFQPSFLIVAAAILMVTGLVVLPMKEAMAEAAPPAQPGARLRAAGAEMRDFAIQSFRSFLGSRGAFAGLFFALLPAGAMCLGLALQTNLSVELGFDDEQVGWLQLWSSILSAGFCVAGGWLSDRLGRRRTLLVYLASMSLPVLYLAWVLQQHGWIMPRPAGGPVPQAVVWAMWVASLSYAALQGLMYGTRTAIFMDVTNPKVAATQFTAYMALMNLAISYSATWQGLAIEALGYPRTMLIDALFGLACIALLPMMKKETEGTALGEPQAAGRARKVALTLGLLCLTWPLLHHHPDWAGAAAPILGTLFTLVFVSSALFLLAGSALLGASALTRTAFWTAPLLLAMHARYHVEKFSPWLAPEFASGLLDGFALAGGLTLLVVATRSWETLQAGPATAR
ncbi:MFS transporter [Paucibacter soli]|uniref:MFS transporter n=1 Tax=Paucibacter soli TaxID=3133433 RepID=UPI0030AB420F